MRKEPELVRCVECRHEYELPPLGEEMGCPECGGISWVSTRIPDSGEQDSARVTRAGYSAFPSDRA